MGAVNTAVSQIIRRMHGATVYLDTNPIIYITDNIAPFLDLTLPFFNAIAQGHMAAITGQATLSELLVKPYAIGDDAAIASIHEFFDTDDFVRLVAHDKDDFILSAQLRAATKLKNTDALHLSTAINNGCTFFLTADKEIVRRARGIEVVNLKDFL